ncbi:MAG TPA: heme o synthase [Planctomycetota bacterium]|nr:heme o synthase [Planctomycetota bacterium]
MHKFARLVALATLCLIFAGGLVKSTETGLSDKTWPQFNGGYEPVLHGETLFEHTHRLIAGTVAALTVALALYASRKEPRRWVRRLAATAAVAVLCQATLGGLTVLFKLHSLPVSLGHAGLAQAFLSIVTALAVVTSPAWRGAHEDPFGGGRDRVLRGLSIATAAAVYGQILLGAWVRYTPGAAFAIPDFPLAYGRLVPPFDGWSIVVQFVHRCGAALVSLLAIATIARVARKHWQEPMLRRPAIALGALLCAQVLLGGATIWTVKAVVPTTFHVATGAAVLACSVILALCAQVAGGEASRESARSPRPAAVRSSLLHDIATLTKVRIAVLVLVATATGYYLASTGPIDWVKFSAAMLGTGILAAGSAALNQVLERDFDALMHRTANRPLPAGRLSLRAAVAIGVGAGVAGIAILAAFTNGLTALLGAATFASYVGIYTPLKRVTWVSTIVGAVPGALPPVMGWAAGCGRLDFEAWALFGILFFWQLPHFFAIAWLNREDYARGGYPMLPVIDGDGLATANQILFSSLALLPLSVAPAVHGRAGPGYLIGAIVLGVAFLVLGVRLAFARSERNARGLFWGSLLYLPLLFALLSLDKQA